VLNGDSLLPHHINLPFHAMNIVRVATCGQNEAGAEVDISLVL